MHTYFRAHNDDDEGLDGLELLKAVIHAHSHENDLNTAHFDEEIALVDVLLKNYDQNENGLLEYPEFMKAFQESRQQLGIQ